MYKIEIKFNVFVYIFSVDVLRQIGSPIIPTWPEFIDTIQKAHDLAKENAQYLQTIEEYLVVKSKELAIKKN